MPEVRIAAKQQPRMLEECHPELEAGISLTYLFIRLTAFLGSIHINAKAFMGSHKARLCAIFIYPTYLAELLKPLTTFLKIRPRTTNPTKIAKAVGICHAL